MPQSFSFSASIPIIIIIIMIMIMIIIIIIIIIMTIIIMIIIHANGNKLGVYVNLNCIKSYYYGIGWIKYLSQFVTLYWSEGSVPKYLSPKLPMPGTI